MTKIDGYWICFNCQGKRRDANNKPYSLRKLEVRRVNPNAKKKKKGKLIQEAMVCFACYDEGHNKIPLDEFNGRVKFVPQAQLPKQIMEKMLKQKEEAQKKVEKAKSLNII